MSVNGLAHLAGIEQAALCRFVNRRRSLSLGSAAKLAAALGLELRAVRKGAKVKSKGKSGRA